MEILLIVVGGLVLLTATSMLASRIGIVAPLLLLLIGIGIGYIPGVPPTILNPEIILIGVLPPLLYGAAVNLPVIDLRRNRKPIFWLSFVLVVVTALIIGFLLHWIVPAIPLPAAIALGAVVAPPDAVAATSVGKRVGMPARLVTILEGESLLNDATSLVLLRTAIAAMAGSFFFWDAVGSFVYAVAVATAVGFVVGAATVWIRSHLSNPVHDTMISFIVPFIAFIPAEELGASGVLAVVIAGLYTGHHAPQHFSATSRINERMNWRTVKFVLENGVFLIMGLETHALINEVQDESFPIHHVALLALLVFVVLVVIRMIAMFPVVWQVRKSTERYEAMQERIMRAKRSHKDRYENGDDAEPSTKEMQYASWLARASRRVEADVNYAREEGLDWRGSVLLGWSGMRGVVTLAAAQTIPENVPFRAHIILIAFGAATLSLLVHGFTLPPLVRALKPADPASDGHLEELHTLHEELLIAAEHAIDQAVTEADVSGDGSGDLSESVIKQAKVASAAAIAPLLLATSLDGGSREPGALTGQTETDKLVELTLLGIEASREELLELRTIGMYSSPALQLASRSIDIFELRYAPPKKG